MRTSCQKKYRALARVMACSLYQHDRDIMTTGFGGQIFIRPS
jgi:hypothetical protein